jgi:AraC-like DNA-binding protein
VTAAVRLYSPSRPLSDLVDYLWFQKGSASSPARERIVPSGTTELVFALHERPLRLSGRDGVLRSVGSAAFCGIHASPFVIGAASHDDLIGVHFRPGGAFPFFAPPASELEEARCALDDLWGGAAAALGEQLAAASSLEGRFALLEWTLLSRIARPLARHPGVAYALARLGGGTEKASIRSLVKETGLSARRFIELFRREVGLTPNLFARVRRFQAVLGRLEDPAGAAWTEVALAHGYFDQPHLVRDFRTFAGLTPTAYLARRGAAMNHVILPDQG